MAMKPEDLAQAVAIVHAHVVALETVMRAMAVANASDSKTAPANVRAIGADLARLVTANAATLQAPDVAEEVAARVRAFFDAVASDLEAQRGQRH